MCPPRFRYAQSCPMPCMRSCVGSHSTNSNMSRWILHQTAKVHADFSAMTTALLGSTGQSKTSLDNLSSVTYPKSSRRFDPHFTFDQKVHLQCASLVCCGWHCKRVGPCLLCLVHKTAATLKFHNFAYLKFSAPMRCIHCR